jgi:hypothetical protein
MTIFLMDIFRLYLNPKIYDFYIIIQNSITYILSNSVNDLDNCLYRRCCFIYYSLV